MERAFLLIACLLIAAPAAAQSDGFAPFWKEFSAAARTHDKAKLSALTKLPEFQAKALTPKQFESAWKAAFPSNRLSCLAKAKPAKEHQRESYYTFCNKMIYTFEREAEGWRLTDIHPND